MPVDSNALIGFMYLVFFIIQKIGYDKNSPIFAHT